MRFDEIREKYNVNPIRDIRNIVVGAIITFISGIILTISVVSYTHSIYVSKNYKDIDAIVVDYDVMSDRESETDTKAVVVQYIVNGKAYRSASREYFDNPAKIGEIVKIKYDPKDPTKCVFKINSESIKFIAISAGAFIVGLIAIISGVKNIKAIRNIVKAAKEQIALDNSENS